MIDVAHQVKQHFSRRFSRSPTGLIRAPGRVNLIGEHTDYNEGLVLPMAIERAIWTAIRPRADEQVCIESLQFDDIVQFRLGADELDRPATGHWGDYVRKVAKELTADGVSLRGFDAVVGSDLPAGAGLSSSAALELTSARAFSMAGGGPWRPKQAALACHRAEVNHIGVQCGIMDQMVCALGRKGHALLIDCRTMETTLVPVPGGVTIMLLDAHTRRALIGSEFNKRRETCRTVARRFGVQALRDVGLADVRAATWLGDTEGRRARHVVTEIDRTREAAHALERGDWPTIGRLLDDSHSSLRDDYEVCCPHVAAIVEIARAQPDCLGARMVGAGFGGCALAVVREANAAAFLTQTVNAYQNATGRSASGFACRSADGVQLQSIA